MSKEVREMFLVLLGLYGYVLLVSGTAIGALILLFGAL